MIGVGGCVAFNLKETFFDRSDTSGLSHLVREMIFRADVPAEFLEALNI